MYTEEDEITFLETHLEHNHMEDSTLKRQQVGNALKRKALEDLTERPSKLIHKELKLLIANPANATERKRVLDEDKYNSTNFMTLWEFDGVLRYTPLFYGWYDNTSSGGYKVPLAYFMTGLVVYGYSFFATLRKMAENSRNSKLSEKDDECIFTWKVFTAWDYMIGNAETAHNRVASIIMGFKEALLEEAEKKKDTRNWRVTSIRVLVNVVVIALLTLSMYVVVLVVKRSTEPEAESTFWRKNEIAIVMSLITFVFPMVFEILGLFEQYHPRKQLRVQLGRIMVLNLVNLYSLIFALIYKIGDMTKELQTFKSITTPNDSLTMSTTKSSEYFVFSTLDCKCFSNKEPLLSRNQILESDEKYLTSEFSDLVANITTLLIANITTTFNESISDIDFLNSSLTNFVNNVIQEQINGHFNLTMENDTISQYLNSTDMEYQFTDYLTYILFSLKDYSANTTLNYDQTTDIRDKISTTWKEFSSTIIPLLNKSDTTTDIGRFDYDLSTSTIFESPSSFSDLSTTTSQEEMTTQMSMCKEFCNQSITPVETLKPTLNYTMNTRLRNLCWETMFGQELISLTVMDLVMTIVPALGMDFFRGIFVRVMNSCWCWDLEKKFPKYGDFKVAENILSLVNNQGMVWMGMFFCPGLVVFNVFKLYIIMYFKAWAVMTCNSPPEVIFRASRSNNFYYYLLLMMLFLCVLPVGYTIVWIKPSWHCGPFSKYQKIFHIFTETIKDNVPEVVQLALDYIASPGIVIPLLVLLILIIYYLLSLTNSLREANDDLKIQLRRERTEERRKMFQMADRRRRGGSGESNELSNTPFNKWKKLLGNMPSGKSLDETPKQEVEEVQIKDGRVDNRGKDFFSKLIKRALGKSSTSEDDQNAEDGTDTEQHDSLPYDTAKSTPKEIKPSLSWGASDFQNVARKALQMKVQPDIQQSASEPKHVKIIDKALVNNHSSDVREIIHTRKEFSTSRNLFSRQKQTNSYDKMTDPIQEISTITEPSTSKEIIKNISIKEVVDKPFVSRGNRQDSSSSIWSDGIPVITISKTESSENILCAFSESCDKIENNQKFVPKIKCVLKKQTTIDEDTIRYYNEDLEKNMFLVETLKTLTEEDMSVKSKADLQIDDLKYDESLTDKSSSEDTEQKECSTDTILQSPVVRNKDK